MTKANEPSAASIAEYLEGRKGKEGPSCQVEELPMIRQLAAI